MEEMLQQITAFIKERDWEQFHNPKDLAISLMLEAGEILEHFQWKTPEEMQTHLAAHRSEVGDELADALYWVLLMSYYFKIDLSEAFTRKMAKNRLKYPVTQAKGRHDKYTAYQGENS